MESDEKIYLRVDIYAGRLPRYVICYLHKTLRYYRIMNINFHFTHMGNERYIYDGENMRTRIEINLSHKLLDGNLHFHIYDTKTERIICDVSSDCPILKKRLWKNDKN